jgi:hypothetical protein
MSTNLASSPTIRAAVADLQRVGFLLDIHFTLATALQLRDDLASARAMWDDLARTTPATLRP